MRHVPNFREPAYLALVCVTMLGCASTGSRADGPSSISVTDFGAKGNWNYADRTGADDTAAIQRALDRAAEATSKSSVVCFPPGSYRVSSTIRLPNWVRLRGDNGRNSQIHADPQFTDPYMFRASNGRQSMFNSRMEELWIRVHGNPSIRAVIKADAWQENDGLMRVVITGFTRYGVELEFGYGGAATLHIEDCEIFAGANAKGDSAGIYVHQISQVSAFLLRVDSTTIAGSSAAKPLGYGIFMEHDTLVARVVHFEYVRHGVYLDRKANAVLDALTGSYTKASPSCLITLSGKWGGFLSGRGLMPNGFDYTVRDERTGDDTKVTLTEIALPARSSP